MPDPVSLGLARDIIASIASHVKARYPCYVAVSDDGLEAWIFCQGAPDIHIKLESLEEAENRA